MRSTGSPSIPTRSCTLPAELNLYPGPVEPADVVARIEAAVETIYIRVLPLSDPWGNAYLYWSDTRAYALVGFGADGLPEFPYSTWGRAEFEGLHGGPTFDAGRDVVFVEGRFVQWPAIGSGP